ncbi:MAG TPA: hypothetical protein PKM50_06965 [Methanoregula sp.]|nr:hypothetical protein [Methanoregula sp.]
MERLKNIAILLQLIDALKENGSWCGETHVQKATYSLQQLKSVPLNFNFILYKHGPFSFDLRDELTAMRADGLISLQIMNESYGPQLRITERGQAILKLFAKTSEEYRNSVQFIGSTLGNKGVVDLEKLATALYVTNDMKIKGTDERVQKIVQLKPHITQEQAEKAVHDIDMLIKSANT